jgi:hypothetical protein
MAQTKRKRKHRGNAAGIVEARGRTGRKPDPKEQRRTTATARRQERLMRPPTWKGAFIRAGFAAALLFVLFMVGLGPKGTSPLTAVLVAVLAMGIYVPLGYATDRFVYNRRLRSAQRKST